MPQVITEKKIEEKLPKVVDDTESLLGQFEGIYKQWHEKIDIGNRPLNLSYAGKLFDTYNTLKKLGFKSLEQLGLRIGKSKTWLSRVFKTVASKEKQDRYLKGHIDLLGNEPKDTLYKTKAKIAFRELREESGNKDYLATPDEIANRAGITVDQAVMYLNSRVGVNPANKVKDGINLILKGLHSKQSTKVYSETLNVLREGIAEVIKLTDVYKKLEPLFKKLTAKK